MFEISSRPYLTNDLAFRLCFSIFYRFNVYVFMFINGIRPYKSSADQSQTDARCALCRAGECLRCGMLYEKHIIIHNKYIRIGVNGLPTRTLR